MLEKIITKNDSGQRIDRYLLKSFPLLTSSSMYKYMRRGRVKINGKKCASSVKLAEGDVLQLYINDEFLEIPAQNQAFLHVPRELNIIYEDMNIMLLDKPAGLLVHEDDSGQMDTLLNRIKAYLYNEGKWNPCEDTSFEPSLCNRIDRNTGGIVIAAKNAEALREMNEMIRSRKVEKVYLCLVHGKPMPESGELSGYITRDFEKKHVKVTGHKTRESKTAKTLYKVLETRGNISLVECRLVTGRTHQIRAQMAEFRHPLVGDTKYGTVRQNEGYPFKYQALYSYKIRFDAKESTSLAYLDNHSYRVKDVPFMEYFNSLDTK